MDIFPTQYSTLSSMALKDRIAESYDLPLSSCRFLLRGVSDTYVLESERGKYILKIYREAHRSLEEIMGEVELLHILKEGGCKISYPIKDTEGRQVQHFNAAEGTRHGVLFSFAKGRNVYDLSVEQLGIVGKEMAYNHNITATIELKHRRKGYDINQTVHAPLKILEQSFKEFELEAEYDWLKGAAAVSVERLAVFDTSLFSFGYCHYDYFPKNFFFDDDNNITLFDFDFAGKGFLANDLASVFVHFFFDIMYGGVPLEQALKSFDAIIAGYRTVRQLPDEEVKAVPFLGFHLLLFYLGFQYENFDDWSNVFWGLKYVKGRVGAMKRYAELFCGIENIISPH